MEVYKGKKSINKRRYQAYLSSKPPDISLHALPFLCHPSPFPGCSTALIFHLIFFFLNRQPWGLRVCVILLGLKTLNKAKPPGEHQCQVHFSDIRGIFFFSLLVQSKIGCIQVSRRPEIAPSQGSIQEQNGIPCLGVGQGFLQEGRHLEWSPAKNTPNS